MIKQLTKLYKALGDANSLRILKILEVRSLCHCEIMKILKLPSLSAAKHVTLLLNAELVIGERQESWIYYHLNESSPDLSLARILLSLDPDSPFNKILQIDTKEVKYMDQEAICGSFSEQDVSSLPV